MPDARRPTERIAEKLGDLPARTCHDLSKPFKEKERSLLGLPRLLGLSGLLDPDVPLGFLSGTPLQLMIDDHFDLAVDVLVKDGELATLGLIHVMPDELKRHDGRPIGADEWCRERIDEAVYLRHLLLTKTRHPDTRPRPLAYTVEVVLCFPRHLSQHIPSAGAALRTLAATGSFLHAIGINLWQLDEEDAQQAMPWLLSASVAGIEHLARMQDARATGSAATKGASTSVPVFGDVTLTNFRLRGERRFRFAPDSRLHLVHGPNGSGKSSIVEAVELAMTGKIARLQKGSDPSNYERVLQNRDERDAQHRKREAGHNGDVHAATVQIGSSQPMKVVESGIEPSLAPPHGAPELSGNSFRLNQDLADRLAANSAGERAATFLEAFFPDQTGAFEKHRTAGALFETAVQAVPTWVRAELGETSESTPRLDFRMVAKALAWTGGTPDWQHVIAMLARRLGPLDAEWTQKLPVKARERLRERGERSWTDIMSAAATVDEALTALRTAFQSQAPDLSLAISALEHLGSRTLVGHRAREEHVPTLFNQWLEVTAENDLAARIRDVATVIRSVEQHDDGYKRSAFLETMARQWKDAWDTVEDHAPFLARRAEELRIRLAGTITDDTPETQSAAAPQRPLEDFDLDALDRVAKLGLVGAEFEHCEPPLGRAVRIAYSRGFPVDVVAGDTVLLTIGREDGWASRLLGSLRREHDIAAKFLAEWSDANSLVEASTRLKAAADAAVALEKSGKATDLTLQRLLTEGGTDGGTLLRALNEVKALLTPARWAYRAVRAAVDFEHKNELNLNEDDGVSISQRLNTAELNITALSFFLICARRIANPLNILLLDDPLQNMDEWTVTTVARALTKVTRLWQTLEVTEPPPAVPWKIILLLHGQDDVERFRVEMPCAFYRLPWLGPVGAEVAQSEISDDGSLLADTPQNLATVLREA